MTRTLNRITGTLILLALLTACGSSPLSNYYRLTPAVAPSPTGQSPAIGIGPVEIPEFLKRNALVYTRGGNQLQIDGTERWAEPLVFGVKRVVGMNLSQLLDTEDLQFFPWDVRRAPDYGVKISVLDLDATEGQATLIAEWVLYQATDGSAITRRISQFSEPLSPGPTVTSQLPAAYSAMLYELSETIAATIRVQQGKAVEESHQP